MARRLIVPLALAACSCVWTFQNVEVTPLERRPADSVSVVSPVKAHLADGSTVVFPDGAELFHDTVWGAGTRYDVTLRDSAPVTRLPLDSVAGMEVFRTRVDNATSIVVSLLATGGAAFGTGLLAVAIFGSCPTYYADSAGVLALEAEGFSYSIAPLFEARDVDRLALAPGPHGAVRLEVRNEALETHDINHLELLEVRHAAEETALTDERNAPLVVRDLRAPRRATDRLGRDVRALLAASDGEVYRTDARVLDRARGGDLEDAIEIAFPAPPAADSVALVLRLRNSLLNTILLYDLMLGDPGARSLDWLGRDLERVGPAVELAQWYQRRMGMQIAVWDGRGYRHVAHLKDTGPIAWKDVAIVAPVPEHDSVRVRLTFPADNWRIDRVELADRFRHAAPIAHHLTDVVDAAGRADTAARASLAAADGRYLETSPGQRFTAQFDVGAAPAGGRRTFFVASQGYYTEWVRRGWLLAPRTTTTFVPSDSALSQAIARWRVTQDTLEARFMAARIPVR
jgi:hypothetical protein